MNGMKHTTKIISLINQKGGVGKSAIALFLSNYLHYYKGYNVALVDTDELQLSLYKRRLEEAAIFKKNEIIQEVVKRQANPNLYEVFRLDEKQKITLFLEDLKEKDAYDYIIVDTKGAASEVTYQLSFISDFIFVPVIPKLAVCESTETTTFLLSNVKGKVFLLWNMYRKTPKVEEEMKKFKRLFFSEFNFLQTAVPERLSIPRRNFYNTLYYSEKEMSKEAGELNTCLAEIYNLIK